MDALYTHAVYLIAVQTDLVCVMADTPEDLEILERELGLSPVTPRQQQTGWSPQIQHPQPQQRMQRPTFGGPQVYFFHCV